MVWRHSIHKAIDAPPRLTSDSSASDSRPTEPVTYQARLFSAIVASAAAIDSQAKRVSDRRAGFSLTAPV
jgi:hypothetical protein